MKKQTPLASKVLFSIVDIIDKTNNDINICSKMSDELGYFKNDSRQSKQPIQSASGTDIDRTENTDRNSGSHRRISKKPSFLSE